MQNIKIAIDGPAGAGKSSICKIVSKRIGFIHIDTGAMFRAITLKAMNKGIKLENENEYDFLDDTYIFCKDNKIYLDNVDVSDEIRDTLVSDNVSIVSKIPKVRDRVKYFEKSLSNKGNIIMDGRDIGTVILPDAQIKFFLTASPSIRAKRRYDELVVKNKDIDYDMILNNIIDRDEKDSKRDIAPLKMADDAILIDTTNMDINEVSDKIIKIINEYIKKTGV